MSSQALVSIKSGFGAAVLGLAIVLRRKQLIHAVPINNLLSDRPDAPGSLEVANISEECAKAQSKTNRE